MPMRGPKFVVVGLTSVRSPSEPPVAKLSEPEPAGLKFATWFLPSYGGVAKS